MLRKKLQDDQISALKAKDQLRLDLLRYILAQIKNKEIDKKRPLDDEEIVEQLRKTAKELEESITAFQKGNRPDLVASHQKQLTILVSYLPAQLSDDQLKEEIGKIIADNRQIYEKNPKAIIGICIKKLKNKADPRRIVKLLQ